MPPRKCFVLTAIITGTLVLASCDNNGSDPPDVSYDREGMLTNFANNLILPAYLQLQNTADILNRSIGAFTASPSESNLATAQQALKDVRLAWQSASLFQFGPAESIALRASLNTYPTNADRVEENIASGSYVLGSVADQAAGGLPALAYLLHGIADTQADIVSAYSTEPDAAQRISYLQDNATFVRNNVDSTTDAWQPSSGNYVATFLSGAKGGTDVGSSLGQLVNALVLHYERFLRDGKIGIPAGVRSAGVPRPSTTEAYYGGYSLELAIVNLNALENVFKGTGLDGMDGSGLEENLQALDAADLATDILTSFDSARNGLDALADPLSTHIESDNDAVLAAFSTMQQLVVQLKADMTSVLGITITFQDNDGD